jgi:predicted transposase/invertase (TIGR01784 family)
MHRFLDPKNDFAFKRVFGTEKNKEILINFLNDALDGQQDKIEDVEFLKTSQDPEIAVLRQSIVDVKCKDLNGNIFIVEMQCSSDSHFIKRAVAYASRAYLDQRVRNDENAGKNVGKGKKGASYAHMHPVIFFAILNNPLFPDKKEYLSHHRVTDVCTQENDIKELSFSFLELSKFRKDSIDQLETNIEKWAHFFKYAGSVDPDEMRALEERDRRFWKAYTALAEYNYTPEELMDYERYDMKQDEIAASLSDAEKRGEARGEARGEIKKAKETAQKMLRKGVDPADISEFTGLSVVEIESLRNNSKSNALISDTKARTL